MLIISSSLATKCERSGMVADKNIQLYLISSGAIELILLTYFSLSFFISIEKA
jgi:hypothetical protein